MMKLSVNKVAGVAGLNDPLARIALFRNGQQLPAHIEPLTDTAAMIRNRHVLVRNNTPQAAANDILLYRSKMINSTGDELMPALSGELFFQYIPGFYDPAYTISGLEIKNNNNPLFFTTKIISPRYSFLKESAVAFDFSIKRKSDNATVFAATLRPFKKDAAGLKQYVRLTKELSFLPSGFYIINNETCFLDCANEVKPGYLVFSVTI